MSQNSCIINEESKLLNNPGVLRNMEAFRTSFNNRARKNCYTPDIPYLESKCGHLLFVYGTLKQGYSRHWMLKTYQSRFVATAITFNNYSLFYAPKLGFPVMMPSFDSSPVGNVVGQLWVVPPKVMLILDECEKNGDMYFRYRIKTQLITKPTHRDFQQYGTTSAYCYIGNPKEWGTHIKTNRMLSMVPTDNHFLNFQHPKILTP